MEKQNSKFMVHATLTENSYSTSAYCKLTLGFSLEKILESEFPYRTWSGYPSSPASFSLSWDLQVQFDKSADPDWVAGWYFNGVNMNVRSTAYIKNADVISDLLTAVRADKNSFQPGQILYYAYEDPKPVLERLSASHRFFHVYADPRLGGDMVIIKNAPDKSLNSYQIEYKTAKLFHSLRKYSDMPRFFATDIAAARTNLVKLMIENKDYEALADFKNAEFAVEEIPYSVYSRTFGVDTTFLNFGDCIAVAEELQKKGVMELRELKAKMQESAD
jgi:hypothetical protein